MALWFGRKNEEDDVKDQTPVEEEEGGVEIVDRIEEEEEERVEGVKMGEVHGEDKTEVLAKEISEGLKKLSESLRVQPQGMEIGGKKEEEEDIDPQELDALLMEQGGLAKALKKVLSTKEKKIKEEVAAEFATLLAQQRKELLKVNPETRDLFTRYEGEIEQRVQQLPPEVRMNPHVYDLVYKQVVMEHQDEIVEEKAKRLAEEMLKQMGVDVGGGGVQQRGVGVAGGFEGGMMVQSGGGKKKKVKITRAMAEKMEALGLDTMDPEHVVVFREMYGGR